jgi:ADP-ribosyl-[dinitrogen reductase] hydrolase
MRTGPKDIGNQTRQALSLLASGLRWDEAGERLQRESARGVAGNGSVMRCAPIALRFRSHSERMVQVAIDTSRITHADSRATWGSVAICQGIVHLLNGGAIDSVLDAAMADVEDDVRAAVAAARTLDYQYVRSSGFVLETITAALWSLLHEDSAEDVVVRAAMMGDDADITATVAGALAGAAHGVEAIPQRWRSVLRDRSEIQALARRLLAWDMQG